MTALNKLEEFKDAWLMALGYIQWYGPVTSSGIAADTDLPIRLVNQVLKRGIKQDWVEETSEGYILTPKGNRNIAKALHDK